MNIDQILADTLKNGGTTVFYGRGIPYDRGFVVGIYPGTFMTVPLDSVDLFPEAVKLVRKDFPYVDGFGTWVNGENIEIDPIAWVAHRKWAVQMAKDYNQKAIFDLSTKEVIDASEF